MLFAKCRGSVCSGEEPQAIELSDAVARRIRMTMKGLKRARGMLDGKISEVDWDVSESSAPIVITTKFSFWAGRSERVETSSSDDVFYALVNRGPFPIWGRFVRNRKGEMTRHQTVILRPVCDAGPVAWRVVAAYVGEPAPAFPGDPFADADSRDHWLRHALIDGTLPYDKATVTAECPW